MSLLGLRVGFLARLFIFFEALGVLVIYHPNTFSRSIPSDFFTGTVSYGRPNV